MTSFADLGLSDAALKAVRDLGYEQPTPIQEQAIPLVLGGSDIIAAAKTGTGKTAAFSLPALDRLPRGAAKKKPRMLVITPTRELATQIEEVCAAIAKHTGHKLASVVGGVSINPQIQRLARGVDVLVATPGRLIDLMNQQAVSLSAVEILVLDEADRMLDMGFLPSVTRIVKATPTTRQTLLFSATVDKSIMSQVGSMLHDPQIVQIAVKGETADTVDQYIVNVPHTLKPQLLAALLAEHGSERVIVFARTRRRADTACRKLKRAGFSAEAIHSDRSQNQRRRSLDRFAAGEIDIIVATDVLARGIDVNEVSYVVNYDLPTQPEDYVHRIGRTGRAGARGFAVSFVSPENASDLKAIEKFIKRSIPQLIVEGFDEEEEAAKAVERAARASAKRDPEVAEAARELAKRERKKAKKQRAKQDEQTAGEQPSGRKKKARGGSDAPAAPRKSGGAAAKQGGKQKHAGAAKKTPKRTRQGGASARPAADMRPGRAHRAAVAERRRAHR